MNRPVFLYLEPYVSGPGPELPEAHIDWMLDWMLLRIQHDTDVYIDAYSETAQDAILRLIRSVEVDGDGPASTVTIVTSRPEVEERYRILEV